MAVGFQILKQQTGKRGNTLLNNWGVRTQKQFKQQQQKHIFRDFNRMIGSLQYMYSSNQLPSKPR